MKSSTTPTSKTRMIISYLPASKAGVKFSRREIGTSYLIAKTQNIKR